MDWLEFVAAVFGSLAWPLTVLVIVALLRKPLGDLIPLLQRLKFKDLELEFGERIEDVKAEFADALPMTSAPNIPERTRQLAQVSPRSAVLESWRTIERAARDAAEAHGIQLSPREAGSTAQLLRRLERSGVIEENRIPLLHELRMLRNEAAHAPDFALSEESALEYAAVAQQIAEGVKTTTRRPS